MTFDQAPSGPPFALPGRRKDGKDKSARSRRCLHTGCRAMNENRKYFDSERKRHVIAARRSSELDLHLPRGAVADGCYELIGLVPASSDFTLERAVQHFSALTFSRYRGERPVYVKEPVRAELTSAERESSSTGFRVWYGSWSVVAWLDSGPDVSEDNRNLSEEPGLPAAPEVIASCPFRLFVYSDVDAPDFDNSDQFTEYTDQLRERFGVFLLDNVNGGWWT